MIERASWRQGPADPRTPLGTHLGRDSWLDLPIGLWIVIYAAALGSITSFLPGDVGWFVFFLGLAPLLSPRKGHRSPRSFSRLGVWRTWALATSNPFALFAAKMDAVADLVPLPTPDACFGVEITLRRNERITGGDLGVVVFSEGWLVYEGRTTAFSLSPGDVRRAWPGTTAWTLYLPEAQSLTLVSYDPGWKAAIERWVASASPPGLSRLPPLAPNVIYRLQVPGYLHLGAAILAGMGLATVFTQTGLRGAAAFAVMALLLFALGSLIGWGRRRRA